MSSNLVLDDILRVTDTDLSNSDKQIPWSTGFGRELGSNAHPQSFKVVNKRLFPRS